MLEGLGLFAAKLFLDWAWPKLLSFFSDKLEAIQESRYFNGRKDQIEKANNKVKKQIEKAAEATSKREDRRRAARENAKRP